MFNHILNCNFRGKLTFNDFVMSDFTTKNGSEERESSGRQCCVFDWTPGEEVTGYSGAGIQSGAKSSVVFESDIIDARF